MTFSEVFKIILGFSNWFSLSIKRLLECYKGYGRIELLIYDLQSKCRPSATYPFLLVMLYTLPMETNLFNLPPLFRKILKSSYERQSKTLLFLLIILFKNLNNIQIHIRIIKLYLQNVNIKSLIQNQGDDFLLNDKLKHVIILYLKIMFLQ